MVLTSGFQIKSTFSAVSLATSAFQVRGYEPKSSVGANWAGLTKMETITFAARRFASRTSDTWPSGSAPMVGTSATVAFLTRRPSRARRNAGTVRTIMGLRGIRARFVGSCRQVALTVGRGRHPIKADAASPSRVLIRKRLNRSGKCGLSHRHRELGMRFMIEADNQWFEAVIAHFA